MQYNIDYEILSYTKYIKRLNKILNKTLFGKDGLVCEKYIK